MMRTFLAILCITILNAANAQSGTKKFSIGVEQDLLPYATGGYFGGIWAGKEHIRGRALVARVHKPDFVIKKGFSNNNVTAYALLADYFLKDNWNGCGRVLVLFTGKAVFKQASNKLLPTLKIFY